MADIFSSHPYPGRKTINPSTHHCAVCDRTLAYKDRAAHDRSKKHRAELDREKAKEAAANGHAEGNENLDPNACHNCGQSGHMSKECPEPRKMTGACFNCGEIGHNKSDCTKERVITCNNCKAEGHMSRDCPEPRSAANITCNNCSQLGHFSRECPEPKNWAKVTCNQCGQLGHTVRRCTAAPADYAGHNDAGAPSGNDDWMNNNADGVAETTAVEGDWMQDTTGTAAGEEWGAAPAAPAEW
ncbi:hypothetical protein E4T48_02988 [Aureobasidium sp. EXF-10727]|nr:hypothetical protein E4T48_02988 [Aureobasidium sp. EXF-10727]